MRTQRLGLIQTPDQLRFSYIAVLQGAIQLLHLVNSDSDEEEEEEQEEEVEQVKVAESDDSEEETQGLKCLSASKCCHVSCHTQAHPMASQCPMDLLLVSMESLMMMMTNHLLSLLARQIPCQTIIRTCSDTLPLHRLHHHHHLLLHLHPLLFPLVLQWCTHTQTRQMTRIKPREHT